jgi:hypothetical protein
MYCSLKLFLADLLETHQPNDSKPKLHPHPRFLHPLLTLLITRELPLSPNALILPLQFNPLAAVKHRNTSED